MSMTQVKAEMAEEKLEPLVIVEEGDTVEGVAERRTVVCEAAVVLNNNGDSESAVKKEDEHSEKELSGDIVLSEMPSEAQSLPKQYPVTEEKQGGLHTGNEKDGVEQRPEETDNVNGENREGKETDGETQDAMKCNKAPERSTEHTDTEADQDISTATGHEVDTNGLTSSDRLSMVTESPVGARKQPHHRSTPDFPEALYELLCTLQEGRRLNDQRCSFSLESGFARRRCHSEPNTRRPTHRAIFSSMTSLQREEFFELVATSQARRLDDQRAVLQRSPLPKSIGSRFRGSIKQLTIVRKPAPVTVRRTEEDLYNMILTTQAQGRLEDQRSAAPGPMDDEDFFSLLLRVQGGRMEEQRTELPLNT